MDKQKTIFISITRVILARNVFRAGILKRILDSGKIRAVIILPVEIQRHFREEFKHSNVILEFVNKIRT